MLCNDLQLVTPLDTLLDTQLLDTPLLVCLTSDRTVECRDTRRTEVRSRLASHLIRSGNWTVFLVRNEHHWRSLIIIWYFQLHQGIKSFWLERFPYERCSRFERLSICEDLRGLRSERLWEALIWEVPIKGWQSERKNSCRKRTLCNRKVAAASALTMTSNIRIIDVLLSAFYSEHLDSERGSWNWTAIILWPLSSASMTTESSGSNPAIADESMASDHRLLVFGITACMSYNFWLRSSEANRKHSTQWFSLLTRHSWDHQEWFLQETFLW